MLEGEREKLLHMEDSLRASVIGQDEAIVAMVRTPSGAPGPGCRIPTGRSGSFLFLGPTGVGKTELAKALARFLFDDDNAMVRLDMSEYMEKHAVSRMIGAPPGYVGYDQGGALTEAVRRRPYQVVLFDEIEKAHPGCLQRSAPGARRRPPDRRSRAARWTSATRLIIMTSNLGSEILADQAPGEDSTLVRSQVMAVVRAAFRPEFLNRLDEMLLFHRLTRAQMTDIVEIQLLRLKDLLTARKVTLELDQAAKDWLAERGYDPAYGARPLKRVIQNELQNPLAGLILEGRIGDGDRVGVSAGESGLIINGEAVEAAA